MAVLTPGSLRWCCWCGLLSAGCFTPDATNPTSSGSSETSSGTGESSSSSTGATASTTATTTTEADSSSGPATGSETETSSTTSDDSTGEPTSCLTSDDPFDEQVALANLNTELTDGRAWLAPDELTLYFNSDRPGGAGGFDIYVAVRDDSRSDFGEPTLVTEVSGQAGEYDPALTADGLTMFVSRFDPSVSPNSDLFVASRENLAAGFGMLELVGVVNDPEASTYGSWISADGTVLYFYTSDADAGNLFRAERPANGAFENPVELGELNTDDVETSPVPSDDGLTIYFASNRPGGAGSSDIWVARRSTTDDGFGTPENVSELNTVGGDAPSWLSADGCRLYFASAGDIWFAQRGPGA